MTALRTPAHARRAPHSMQSRRNLGAISAQSRRRSDPAELAAIDYFTATGGQNGAVADGGFVVFAAGNDVRAA